MFHVPTPCKQQLGKRIFGSSVDQGCQWPPRAEAFHSIIFDFASLGPLTDCTITMLRLSFCFIMFFLSLLFSLIPLSFPSVCKNPSLSPMCLRDRTGRIYFLKLICWKDLLKSSFSVMAMKGCPQLHKSTDLAQGNKRKCSTITNLQQVNTILYNRSHIMDI